MTVPLAQSAKTQPADRGRLWRDRSFLLLWSGQTVGELSGRISMVAIPLLAADTLNATVFQVALLTFIAWLPYLVFSLPAGVLADRVDQRRLMIACDVGRAVLMLAVPAAALIGQLRLGLLYAVVGLSGVLTVLFSVAYRSWLPRMVTADQLVEGNAKLELSQEFAKLIGPVVSGGLIGLAGAARTFLSNSLAFAVSALTLGLIRQAPTPVPAPVSGRVPSRTELVEGLTFVLRHPVLSKIIACTTTSNFFVMAASSIEVTFLLRTLHADSVLVGLVFSTGAIGGLITGALADRLVAWIGSARVIWVAMAAPGPLYLCMPLAQPDWGVLLFGVGLTAFSANAVLYNIAAMSYRQRVTPPGLLGRVNAAAMWISYGFIPLGALAGGALAAHLGLRTALVICVLGMWSAALFVICSPLRRMRDLPTG